MDSAQLAAEAGQARRQFMPLRFAQFDHCQLISHGFNPLAPGMQFATGFGSQGGITGLAHFFKCTDKHVGLDRARYRQLCKRQERLPNLLHRCVREHCLW